MKKYCYSILLFLYLLNVPEICDIIFYVTPLCAGNTKLLSPMVTFWNNVVISLCSSVNTQTRRLSVFSPGFLMLSSWCSLVKLYTCLIPDVCFWINPSQRSKAGDFFFPELIHILSGTAALTAWFTFAFLLD